MSQLATSGQHATRLAVRQCIAAGHIVGPVPCAEVRAAGVRESYRQGFPHEWVAAEMAIERALIGKEEKCSAPRQSSTC